MISAGIDCGAKNTKTVIIKDSKIIGKGSVPTGFDQEKAVEDSLALALESASLSRDDIEKIGGNLLKFLQTRINTELREN